jgi:hypothetical protein
VLSSDVEYHRDPNSDTCTSRQLEAHAESEQDTLGADLLPVMATPAPSAEVSLQPAAQVSSNLAAQVSPNLVTHV